MIRSLDRSVGRVMDALKANGLDDNTLVLFSSDNGGAGYVGLPDVNAPYRGWKISMFEGGIRVPFLARWPERLPAGATYTTPFITLICMRRQRPPPELIFQRIES